MSLPVDKAVVITKIEYFILNFYNDPDGLFHEICGLIDAHDIAAMNDTMTYFYEMLSFRGYAEHARAFAERYSLQSHSDQRGNEI